MSDAIDRRSFLAQGLRTAAGAAVLGGGASSLLAACSSGGGTTTSTGTNAGVSTATPRRGGSVTFGTDSEMNGFDPTTNTWDETSYLYTRCVYDTLATVDASGAFKPYLAQSITPNSDYTKWTIVARPNVTFHDGSALTSAAIKTNLDAVR